MLLARIICSDPECTEELELAVELLDELDGLSCECGYGYVTLAVSELAPGDAEVVELRPAGRIRTRAERKAA